MLVIAARSTLVDELELIDVRVHVHAHAHAGAANGVANGSDYDAGRVEYDVASGLINYEEYHPFGTSAYRAVDSTIQVTAKRYRYAAAERDEETGLDHMGLRYYAPWLGRWTSADPIGLGDGVNRYSYVHGNPVSMRDPGGTKAENPVLELRRASSPEPRVFVSGSDASPGLSVGIRFGRSSDGPRRSGKQADPPSTEPASSTPTERQSPVSLGVAGKELEEVASAAKPWVQLRRFLVRKEGPAVAEAAKEIGLLPRAGSGKTLPAEHALEHKLSDSPWISASERRKGAPRFEGEPIRIDVEEAVRTGSEYISNKELQGHVREYGKANPEWAHPAEIWRNNQSGRLGEREALLKGPVEPSAIETKALRGARGLAKGLGVAGVALSGYRIATASPEEQTQVAAEEAAGWAGAMLAGEVGAQFGAAAGPWGALVGGVVGGIVGYLGGSSYVRALFELGKDQPPEYGIIADQPGLLFRRPV